MLDSYTSTCSTQTTAPGDKIDEVHLAEETDKPIYEQDKDSDVRDPDETPLRDRKVVTQPYDIAVESLVDQVRNGTIFVRPLSDRPKYQRQYVWTNALASRLVESILLGVPIPPCYLSQNDDFELDVIDGQQRIYSLYRFVDNQFELSPLEVLGELGGKRFHEIDPRLQRKLKTHSLRCVLITNESHPEIKFDVFQRLNSNTVPLNSQELRNCIYRGPLNDLLGELSYDPSWLKILGRKNPDKRLRDEELILRFFAFHLSGIESYRTPQKHWLNDIAKSGRKFDEGKISSLRHLWTKTIKNILIWYKPDRAFRRPDSKAVNRALFDLLMHSATGLSDEKATSIAPQLRLKVEQMLANEEFSDLVSRSVDHKKRTERRFQMWKQNIEHLL